MAGALIVTAEMGAEEFAWLDSLRRRHYPAERNQPPLQRGCAAAPLVVPVGDDEDPDQLRHVPVLRDDHRAECCAPRHEGREEPGDYDAVGLDSKRHRPPQPGCDVHRQEDSEHDNAEDAGERRPVDRDHQSSDGAEGHQ